MVNMTAEEAREIIREIMGKWDAVRAAVIAAGAAVCDADDITGRILNREFERGA